MGRFFKKAAILFAIVYLLPTLAAAAHWAAKPHPASWREADWSASGVLPDPARAREATIIVMAARTGGFKGAFAVHSWLVIKRAGADRYDRYDVVGWGKPVRRNAYPADGRWYSNLPGVIGQISGPDAEKLIPKVEAAIARYPENRPGDYVVWPGPNSNSFVAAILDEVPELDLVLPPDAVGRDYPVSGRLVAFDTARGDFTVNLFGYLGFAVGRTSGIEVQVLGLVAGLDLRDPAIKVPAWGRLGIPYLSSS